MKCSLFSISLFLLFGTFQFCDPQEANQPKRCNIAYKCSTKSEPIWTTVDGIHCKVWRNQCYLLNENCQRVNRDEPEYRDIGKEKCQALCESNNKCQCPEVNHSPVCGYFDEEKKTFSSQCDMENYICKTGITFELFAQGACPEND